MSSAIQKVNEAVETLKQAKKDYQNTCKEAFYGYLREVFLENPKLDFITILGWTPSFNDGDPCTHSMEILIKDGDFEDWGLEIEDEGESFSKEDGKLNDIPAGRADQINRNIWLFDDYLEETYETNFKLTICRDDSDNISLPENWETMTAEERNNFTVDQKVVGAIKIQKEWYDCGY